MAEVEGTTASNVSWLLSAVGDIAVVDGPSLREILLHIGTSETS
jgi:hypothetical protein